MSVEGENMVFDLLIPVLSVSVERALDDGLPPDLPDVRCLFDEESDEVHIVATALASGPIAELVVHTLMPSYAALWVRYSTQG